MGLPAAAALDDDLSNTQLTPVAQYPDALNNTHSTPTAQAPYAVANAPPVSFQVHSYNDLRLLPQTLAKVGASSRTGCDE